MNKIIYFDNAASRKVYPEVSKLLSKSLENYGNPSSLHSLGEMSNKEINRARNVLAKHIGCKGFEIIFTSGGTESNNLAILGIKDRKKIFISSIEHPSVFEAARNSGLKVIEIPVDGNGEVDYGFLEHRVDSQSLVSVMHVNNVVGSINDLSRIGMICKSKGALFHTDAVQSFGKLKIDVKTMNIDLLTTSAHKLGGLKGSGFLYVSSKVNLYARIFGGGQEKNLRSGTENVSGIMAFAKALEIHQKSFKISKINDLSNYLEENLLEIGAKINVSFGKRVSYIKNFYLPGVLGDNLVYFLSHKGICISAGSACDSHKETNRNVLTNLGLDKNQANYSVRVSLSEFNTKKEIDVLVDHLKKAKSLKIR